MPSSSLPIPPLPSGTDAASTGGLPRAVLSLWLSLMLILLAVFIVLGVEARPSAERSRAALASIAEVFGDGPLALPPAETARRRSAAAVVEALAIDLLAEAPPGAYRFTPDASLQARVLIPVEAMFAAGSDGVDDDANGRLDRIAAAAGALPAGYRLDIVVTVPVTGANPPQPQLAVARAVARAVALANALEGRGLPADRLALGIGAGITDGSGGAVIFDFTAEAGR